MYCPERTDFIIKPDGTKNIIKPEQTTNYLFLKEIYDTIYENKYEKFIKLFPKYLNDNNIIDYIVYSFSKPSNCEYIERYYNLCTCYKDAHDWYINCRRIHEYCYTSACNCINGKTYCILRKAYEEAGKKKSRSKVCRISFSIFELLGVYNMYESDKTDIIKFIESYVIFIHTPVQGITITVGDYIPLDYAFRQYEPITETNKKYKKYLHIDY